MASEPRDKSRAERVAHYEARFVAHLEACASWRYAENREPFLLEARKALEAAVRAVHARTQQATARSRPIDDLLAELNGKGVLSAKELPHFQMIRTRTNPAAHVLEPGEQLDDEDVVTVAANLRNVARWLLSHAKDEGLRQRVDVHLGAIDGVDRRVSPEEEAREVAGELERVRADHQKVTEALRHTKARLVQLERRGVSAVTTHRGFSTVSILAATIAGLLVGGALAAAFMAAPGRSLPTEATPASTVATPGPEDGGTPDASASPDAASWESPVGTARVDPTTDPVCPRGMRRIAGDTLQLGQPVGGRRDWPRPSLRVLAPVGVASFCIDREEVAQEALDAWRTRTGRTPTASCDPPPSPDFPAACVTDEEAALYCADRGGSLPSIAEWELVARRGGVWTAPGTNEWVEDTFPPAVFDRLGCGRVPARCGHRMVRAGRIDDDHLPPPPRVLFSWNAPNPEALARRDLSFRCVVRPGGSSPEEVAAGVRQ
ncbi:MAG: hypothetical protein OHK0013_11920 [Sandaracinaceae bacterium]